MKRITKIFLATMLTLALLAGLPAGAYAGDPGEIESKDAAITALSEDDGSLFEIVDKRGSVEKSYKVTDAMAKAATASTTYTFSTVNTYGSFKTYEDAKGPVLTKLFSNLGISMDDTDKVEISSSDGYRKTVLWGYLTAERYYFPDKWLASEGLTQGQPAVGSSAGAVSVPPIIALGRDGGTVMLGQRAPHEQTNDIFVKYMAGYNSNYKRTGMITITKGDSAAFPVISKATPLSGSTVVDGTEITLSFEHLGYRDGYVYFTTDGSEPTLDSVLYNYNTNLSEDGLVFKPVISLKDVNQKTEAVCLKVKVFGKEKLPSKTTAFTYYVSDKPAPPPVDMSKAKVSIIKITASKKQIKVSWKKVSAALNISKYQLRYKARGASKWTVKTFTASKASGIIKKLKSGKRYVVQMRSCKTVSGKAHYSKWSKIRTSQVIK